MRRYARSQSIGTVAAALDEDRCLEVLVQSDFRLHHAKNGAPLITYEQVRSESQANIEALRTEFAFRTVAFLNTSDLKERKMARKDDQTSDDMGGIKGGKGSTPVSEESAYEQRRCLLALLERRPLEYGMLTEPLEPVQLWRSTRGKRKTIERHSLLGTRKPNSSCGLGIVMGTAP